MNKTENNITNKGQKPPAVFIATDNAAEYRNLLAKELDGDINWGLATNKTEALSCYAGEPVVLGRPDYVAELLQSEPPIKWLQSTWAGVNLLVRLDFQDYVLTGVKDVFGPQMAEYVLAYILAHEIRISSRLRLQQQRQWDESLSGTLRGKVLGFMGTGSIACYIANAAANFDMRLIGYNSSGRKLAPFEEIYSADSLPEFLGQCDYIIGLLPDLPVTDRLLDETAFSHLKETAYLINVGRGNLVDEAALCGALLDKRLAGAVLDVFRQEPLAADSPLWATPNLSITGHIAADSRAEDIAGLFAANYRRFIAGEELNYRVDFAKGY